jgi:VanZ like family/Concanavalin A-like lectin/glucanases superfamily
MSFTARLKPWFHVPRGIQTVALRTTCAGVLFGILVAGLWPFHSPKNDVRWLGGGDGLSFGRYGSIVSAGSFGVNQQRPTAACSIEIWLQPKRVHASGTILAFYRPDREGAGFALRQSLGDLVLRRTDASSAETRSVKIYVDDVLSRRQPVFITISSDQSGTTIFADGAFAKKYENFKLSGQDITGRLVVGNSPVTTDEWSGQLKGLALYDRALSAHEASQHFVDWTTGSLPALGKSEGVVALYLFNEGSGNIVHNQMDSSTDLTIPERFFVLRARFLERPWDEFRPDWNYLKDIGINVGGFIPFGFFFCIYFSLLRKMKHPVAATIAFGFAVSLTIEVSQAFLPTRDSGMTDLITNTLGTGLGAIVVRGKAVQSLLSASGLPAENESTNRRG